MTYEDPRSVARRARLVRDRGLRGVFAWELAGDDDAHSLLHAMAGAWASTGSASG